MRIICIDYPFSVLPPIVQAQMIFYPILAVFGVLANVIAIVILPRGKCGLSKCVSRYLLAMAAADLLVVITSVILRRIDDLYFPLSFLFLTKVCSAHTFVIHAAVDISVWFTLSFTLDRYVTICCFKLRAKYCTEQTATWVIAIVCALACCKNIPWYFTNQPIVVEQGVQWGCAMKTDFYADCTWIFYRWFHYFLSSLLPMFLILLLNVFTVGHILAANKARKILMGSKEDANQNDAEIESRRRSIILLFAISGNYILLWLTYLVFFIYTQIRKRFYSNGYNDPIYIADQTSYMLLLLSCGTNTGIYAVTQTKFRAELKNGVKYPFKMILRCVKERGQ
ncbi:putative G-protein coupled receptor 139 [Rhinoraja longicauda]